MRFKIIIFLQMLLFFCLKSSFSYTQSMGQEVIEIGAPIKDVPDLEEEPSAENEEDKVTSTTIQVATRKDVKKYSVTPNKKSKDVEKISGKQEEDEEAKIEKELADIYKDSVDYKADSSEVTITPKENMTEEEKPIARANTYFKFQPESGNPKDIAKFRTSIDEISCNKNKLSGVIPVTRVSEGSESSTFKQYFHDWDLFTPSPRSVKSIASDIESGYFSGDVDDEEAVAKHIGKSASAASYMPSGDSTGFSVFRVSEDPEDITDESESPKFYQSEVYAVKYHYKDDNDEDVAVVYLWIGANANKDAVIAGIELVTKLEEELEDNVILVKIPQGKETRHFLSLFKGNLIILCGDKETEYKNENFKKSYDDDGLRLFRIEGTKEGVDMRATQIEESSNNLRDDDVAILETPDKAYLWIGKESNENEQAAAKSFMAVLIEEKEIEEVNQGDESDDFWEVLGGQPEEKEDSSGWRVKANRRVTAPPALTAVTITRSGKIKFEELPPDFKQNDLSDDGAYVVDNGEELYLWLGKNIPERVKEARLEIIAEYIEDDGLERTVESAIVVTLKQGKEPAVFKNMFPEWDNDLWDNQESYEDIKNEAKSHNSK